jgi:hypothetical protein
MDLGEPVQGSDVLGVEAVRRGVSGVLAAMDMLDMGDADGNVRDMLMQALADVPNLFAGASQVHFVLAPELRAKHGHSISARVSSPVPTAP